jgi:hypothetical protein
MKEKIYEGIDVVVAPCPNLRDVNHFLKEAAASRKTWIEMIRCIRGIEKQFCKELLKT